MLLYTWELKQNDGNELNLLTLQKNGQFFCNFLVSRLLENGLVLEICSELCKSPKSNLGKLIMLTRGGDLIAVA